jgi:hypothetical protein
MLHVSSNAASVTKNGRNKRKLGVFTKAQKIEAPRGAGASNEAVNYIEATSNPSVPFFCDIPHETGPKREIGSLASNALGNDHALSEALRHARIDAPPRIGYQHDPAMTHHVQILSLKPTARTAAAWSMDCVAFMFRANFERLPGS